jgi:hypothetical protein
MNGIINILIFLIVLFLYIHIVDQLKKSEDLEIYEMDYSSNNQLQEVCNIRQPVLFEYRDVNPEFFEKTGIEHVSKNNHDVKVKDIDDYHNDTNDNVDYVVLPFQSYHNLITSDPRGKYFTENNQDFLEESGLFDACKENDELLKPTLNMYSKYDICMASKNTITPLRYHTNYRHFVCVNSGKIHIKMAPWKSRKFLHPFKDYENYEFRSPINVWKPQPEYLHDMDKIKFLEFDVNAGYVLYIPPYWWYSIKYSAKPDNLVYSFTYNSVMNCVTNLPHYGLYYLQQHNIKKKIVKTLTIENLEHIETMENLDTTKPEENQESMDNEKRGPTHVNGESLSNPLPSPLPKPIF